ncbi:single-stranded DNA-binding protein [Moraxella bovis]|uniref:Single-stranded DNA-binding protein n=1 Tax=Moraxella bovis TaxID=476 RepID=A0A378PY16_MORBO|nr:single-stranded DNA-binding protein [Moraxella bovis]STY93392.1 Helix-destabilizing protein [Moraxella bovis]
MSDLNQCNFIGRLGDNPQMRTTQSGDTMATFSIAVSEKWNDKQGNRQEKTEWVNIQAFGKLAEIMGQYLTKGSQVFISGKFQSRKFTSQDGVERTAVSILAKDMQMLGGGQNQQQGQWDGQSPQGQWQQSQQGGQAPNTAYNRNPQGQWGNQNGFTGGIPNEFQPPHYQNHGGQNMGKW